ncbi:XtrA/YqaO family protein [Aureibacillus halotolerans]|uniref:Uncharacterized protein n=1 Tax=Aureibacillus halotolerans TaxID=1508390 RepID=A0A4V3D3X5_9BACI|nr:XtrA/YqaO family protein [Aureibacillus halotolerans]TDQ31899.1 hypothetical protein EV213_1344 [Aureibacillus halotolerans]
MRLKPLAVNIDTGKIDLDVLQQETPFIVVACNGTYKLCELPEHGETKVITHQGQVKRVKFDEGEEF